MKRWIAACGVMGGLACAPAWSQWNTLTIDVRQSDSFDTPYVGVCSTSSSGATLSNFACNPAGQVGEYATLGSATISGNAVLTGAGQVTLPSLGTYAQLTRSAVQPVAPTNIIVTANALQRNYLTWNTAPNQLTIDFRVTGSVTGGRSPGSSQMIAGASVTGTAGWLSPGALQPVFNLGVDTVNGTANVGVDLSCAANQSCGAPNADVSASGTSSLAFGDDVSIIALGSDRYRATLGARFFSAAAPPEVIPGVPLAGQQSVALDFAMTSYVSFSLPAWLPPAVIQPYLGFNGVSDFSHTMAVDGLAAFDEFGNDITATSGIGLNMVAEVPEPATWLFMAAGLAVVCTRAGRRRATTVREAPARGSPVGA